MGTGYTRNDTTNNIADGGVIDAADLDGEFDAIVAAFSESTGHTHDGTGAEGAPIEVLGPAQDFIADAAALYPKATSTYALGTVGATYSNVFTDGLTILGTAIVATPAEINNLSGVTSTTAELNLLDGVTSTTAELNILDGVTATTAELNILDGVTATTAELNILDGVTSTAAELNLLDGVTSTTAELNILDGVTSTAAELNILDGVTTTTAELNILDGVTATAVEINHLVGQDQGVATTDSPTFTEVTINDDVILNSDLAKVTFGADSEIQLEHSADEGLKVKNTKTTAATPVRVTLESNEGTLTANDEIASIDFDSNAVAGGDSVGTKASIGVYATNTYSATEAGSRMEFYTSTDAGAVVKSLTLGQDQSADFTGNMTVGGGIDGTVIGGTTPAAISGTTGSFTGDLTVDTSTLHVDSSNNRVGVGTVSPTERLDVVNGVARFPNNITPAVENDGAAYFGKIGSIAAISGSAGVAFRQSGTELGRINSTGLGIGTSSPSAPLDVVGNAEINGDALIISSSATPLHVDRSTSSGASTIQVSNSTHTTYFGTRSGGGFAIDDDADLGAAPWFVIDTAGQVGIGTTSPSAALDVVGTTELNGNTTVDGTFTVQGSTGSIFLTDSDVSATSRIWQTGENLYIDNQSIIGGDTYFRTDNGKIRQLIRDNGDISFRDTAGTTDGLHWDAADESLGIGTTSPLSGIHLKGAGQTTSALTDAGSANTFLRVSHDNTVVGSGGGILFANVQADSANSLGMAAIKGLLTSGSGNTTGDLAFSVRSNTADTALTEAMRIKSSGDLLVGKNVTDFTTAGIQLRPADGSSFTQDGVQPLSLNRLTSDGSILKLFKTGVEVGSISVTASATAYNTSSDYRLKENVTPVQGAADIVKAMQPVTYTFKSDGSWHDGFLAHELQELHPRAVIGEKDAMKDEEYEVTPAVYEDVIIPAVEAVAEVPAVYDDEGVLVSEMVPAVEAQPERTEQQLVSGAVMGTRSVPDYQGVDYSKLTPILTAALQEALNKIDALETRLAALEAV